jgi:hypothetical protein
VPVTIVTVAADDRLLAHALFASAV